jgi:hypothetical protein
VSTPTTVVESRLAGSGQLELAGLLADVERMLRRFVAFPEDAQPVAVALWVAHAHAIEAADTTAYLHVHSAEKRSGKTRALEVLELLVPSPIRASTISPAALFRLLDMERRTLLLDEVDAIFSPKSDREELRGLLNAGYRRGSSAWRVDVSGKSLTPRAYDAFGCKVLAGIGGLPDTIADRAIPIELRRRRRDEPVESFRYREVREEAEDLRSRLAACFHETAVAELAMARPTLPDLEGDRALEAWEPLLAIADRAGGSWPERARSSAVALHTDRTDADGGDGVQTLAAIRDLFEELGTDRLPTDELLRSLAGRDDGPWPYWFAEDLDRADREGRIPRRAARKLARVLELYRVHPTKLRTSPTTTARGYLRADFADPWSRYLPPPGKNGTSGTNGTPQVGTTSDVPSVPDVPFPRGVEPAAEDGLAATVRRAVEAAGGNRFSAARDLAEAGVPSPDGHAWTAVKIERLEREAAGA